MRILTLQMQTMPVYSERFTLEVISDAYDESITRTSLNSWSRKQAYRTVLASSIVGLTISRSIITVN